MPKSKRAAAATGENAVIPTPRTQADRMYREAVECVRQRQRYAKLVDNGVDEDEQRGALRIVCIADEVLVASVKAYEEIAARDSAHRQEEWWHKANSLWHASREYNRRHADCDSRSRTFATHSPARLAELTMEYDLEASALLALRQSLTAYRKSVPDADIESGTARVA
ncbi:MAG: hypothetical protein ABIZ91_12785 [Gemmatimonadaceae bacterium]